MTNLTDTRLKQQLNFLYEIDKLKTVFRRTTLLADPTRFENTAEHSWHLAFFVLILAEYADNQINIVRVLKMVLLHDLVEIDAGDTFTYDEKAHIGKEERELLAAQRIFGLLPEDQRQELMDLWLEFESGKTTDAKFAVTVDRLQPVLYNYIQGGGSWTRHAVVRAQVEKRIAPIKESSAELTEYLQQLLDDAVKNGVLAA